MIQKHNAEMERKISAEINRLRAVQLEKNEAFNAVVTARADLAELETVWAATSGHTCSTTRTARLGVIRQRMDVIEKKLSNAEAFCRRVDPERLQLHDDEALRVADERRRQREVELAEQERLEEMARCRAAAAAKARMAVKAQRLADEASLLARLEQE